MSNREVIAKAVGEALNRHGDICLDLTEDVINTVHRAQIAELGWIPVTEDTPDHGDLIAGVNMNMDHPHPMSHIWTEIWDDQEPTGDMTHWFLLPSEIKND